MATKAAKILIAEDERDIRELMGAVVSGSGAAVILASDGEEALAIYRESLEPGSPYAVAGIFTDLNMPRMSGDALTAAVRRVSPKVPIYAVTAAEPDSPKYADMLANLRAAGPTGIFAKPIDIEQVMGAASSMVARYCACEGKY